MPHADIAARREYAKAYREINREKLLAANKAYRQTPEARKKARARKRPYDAAERKRRYEEHGCKWQQTHPDKVREMARRYAKENPEKKAAQSRKWVEENPDRYRFNQRCAQHRRRVRKHEGSDGTATREFMAKLYASVTCYYCGWPTLRTRRTAEHKTPVVRGGAHSSDNLVMACRRCNLRKGTRTEEEYRIACEGA